MKTFKILTICLLFSTLLNAQQLEVVNSGGGYHENSEGSITFSIGEVIIETIAHGDLCFTQGFCQANVTVTAVNEIPGLDYELIAYPNPTKNYVILKITREKLSDLKYYLFDMHGKLIKTEQVKATETTIPFNFLIPSTYYLKVIDGQIEVKTFKIVKSR